ncbi:hypothetical protein L9F63_013414 [Diploptera punctata]|uniref:Uncharacterized protein n=1 Tax=Diploptera punctata TaxID=6984 RepID=A0AAD8ELR9_DIPPU|nr:hypothetical protein L9F63_013414 [Diploptera punctata]
MGNRQSRAAPSPGERSWISEPGTQRRAVQRFQEILPRQQAAVQERASQVPRQAQVPQQEVEGAVALPSTYGSIQQPETEMESEQEETMPKPLVPPELLKEVKGFVYHEPDLVLHIHKTLGELEKIARNIDSTKTNIRASTNELLILYNKTTNVFKDYDPIDETIARAIQKLDENVNVQDEVTNGFIAAAESIHRSIQRLNLQISQMTSAVIKKMPTSALVTEP